MRIFSNIFFNLLHVASSHFVTSPTLTQLNTFISSSWVLFFLSLSLRNFALRAHPIYCLLYDGTLNATFSILVSLFFLAVHFSNSSHLLCCAFGPLLSPILLIVHYIIPIFVFNIFFGWTLLTLSFALYIDMLKLSVYWCGIVMCVHVWSVISWCSHSICGSLLHFIAQFSTISIVYHISSVFSHFTMRTSHRFICFHLVVALFHFCLHIRFGFVRRHFFLFSFRLSQFLSQRFRLRPINLASFLLATATDVAEFTVLASNPPPRIVIVKLFFASDYFITHISKKYTSVYIKKNWRCYFECISIFYMLSTLVRFTFALW